MGRDAQKNNIQAAKLIAEIISTSLGPRGMDKMLVDPLGDITITNDGATILKELDVQHPAAKMMVEVAKATDSEVGMVQHLQLYWQEPCWKKQNRLLKMKFIL